MIAGIWIRSDHYEQDHLVAISGDMAVCGRGLHADTRPTNRASQKCSRCQDQDYSQVPPRPAWWSQHLAEQTSYETPEQTELTYREKQLAEQVRQAFDGEWVA